MVRHETSGGAGLATAVWCVWYQTTGYRGFAHVLHGALLLAAIRAASPRISLLVYIKHNKIVLRRCAYASPLARFAQRAAAALLLLYALRRYGHQTA